ncbi:MAG: SPOR domain-containing protein [Flavobacteriales bacterium]|nr:SPOR domain-containing protein [Flavobacteriales bacterium]
MHPPGIARSFFSSKRKVRRLFLALLVCGGALEAVAQGVGGQDDMRSRAEAAYAAGNFLEALADYERLVSLFPEEACLHARLAGCALSEPGRLSLVRRHLRIALRKGCEEADLGYHQARLAQLEYDFERARDLYAAYLASSGKKARFKVEAERGAAACAAVNWSPKEAVALEVRERIPADPEAAFRYYDPAVDGLRLVTTPGDLRSKADVKRGQGRMALHDGDTVLVFSSLGKKGATGWDLYRVSIRQGAYTEPAPLGDRVNSAYDEKDAYLSKQGILYYSSNRPGGLGGFDIYAVDCGLDGVPSGEPFRLPYPINSVNDDEFFIPEADGGAWMASNRAAVQGKVHAYRIGLGQGEMATGSVAWSQDEVDGAGLTLRVFSGGEEVSTGSLQDESIGHLAFAGSEEVRIVLEDRSGNIVAESFGQGEGAWELRKTSSGWNLEGKSEVLADWAVLSDLQVGTGTGRPNPPAALEETSGQKTQGGATNWGDWLTGQRQPEVELTLADASSTEADRPSKAQVPAVDAEEELASPDKDAAEDEASSTAVANAVVAPPSDASEDVTEVTAVGVTEAKTPGATEGATGGEPQDTVEPEVVTVEGQAERLLKGTMESWTEEVPEAQAVVEQLLAERPEDVVKLWEQKAARILTLEAAFLDAPDFVKAGELYDLLDQFEAWVPEVELLAPAFHDATALEEIRNSLDQWSSDVQSVSKPSQAKEAGGAALAVRRNRLALRELQAVDRRDLMALKTQWFEGQRERLEDSVLSDDDVAEFGAVLGQWEAVLGAAEEVWSRKARSGWRGLWLEQEVEEFELTQVNWSEQLAARELEAASAVAAAELETRSTVAEVSAEVEGAEEEATQLEVEGGLTFDAEDVSLVSQLMPSRMAVGVEAESEALAPLDWLTEWDEAVNVSKRVERNWERLSSEAQEAGVAPVASGAQWMELDKPVRLAYKGLLESVVGELVTLKADWQQQRAPAIAAWQTADLEGLAPEWTETLAQVKKWWAEAHSLDEQVDALERLSMADNAAGFDALVQRQQSLADAEYAWREWQRLWSDLEIALVETTAIAESEQPLEVENAAKADEALSAVVEGRSAVEAPENTAMEEVADAVSDEVADVPPANDSTSEEGAMASAENPVTAAEEGIEVKAGLPAASSGNDNQALEAEVEDIADERESEPAVDAPEVDFSEVDLSGVSEGWSQSRIEQVQRLMPELTLRSMEPGAKADWMSEEREAVAAWRERMDIAEGAPPSNAGRAAQMAWDKRQFFNARRLKSALAAVDLEAWEQRVLGADDRAVTVEAVEERLASGEGAFDTEEGQDTASEPEGAIVEAVTDEMPVRARTPETVRAEGVAADTGIEEAVAQVSEEVDEVDEVVNFDTPPAAGIEGVGQSTEVSVAAVVARQDETASRYSVILPEAEVVGSSDRRGDRGLTLRPIERETMERAILSKPSVVSSDEVAAEAFDTERGAPLAEGVEYKIQIGAFRKALPSALFAAFDPMWAQTMSNGITRYMAGSFDAYDPAVEARDAIRALGYQDAFVVRFVDGERVRGSRPPAEELAEERNAVLETSGAEIAASSPSAPGAGVQSAPAGTALDPVEETPVLGLPQRREDIPTWEGVTGRVYSVQVGAFRGVPDQASLASLGTLTREDAGSDGWLRLFSGRFATQAEAEAHRAELRDQGRKDAFIVVYINGRRIPLSQAAVTSTGSLPGRPGSEELSPQAPSAATTVEAPTAEDGPAEAAGWLVELGVFNSTIPVRLANAILDAPLDWEIRSVRTNGLTRYRTKGVVEAKARQWLEEARERGFSNAKLLSR